MQADRSAVHSCTTTQYCWRSYIFIFCLTWALMTFFVILQIKINACSIIMGTSNLTSVSHSNNTNSLMLYRSALYPQSSLYHSVYEHWCTGNARFHICKCARSFGSWEYIRVQNTILSSNQSLAVIPLSGVRSNIGTNIDIGQMAHDSL